MLNLIGKIELIIAKILYVLVFLLFMINVFSRYFFRISRVWSYPLISVLFLWCAVLSISYVLKKRGHISVVVLVDLFPKKMQLFSRLIVYFIMVCTFLILLVSTINIFPVHRARVIFGLDIPVTYYTATVLYLALSGVITSAHFFFLEFKKIILKNQDDSDSKIKPKKNLNLEIEP